jgi:soluble cytochrome b562
MATTNDCQFQSIFPGKVMEALSAFAQANERVVSELIDLSSTAARDGLRTISELQAAAIESMRAVPTPVMPRPETLEELRRDPFAWYRKGFQVLADSTQRAAKLAEANAQIVTRNVERMQASADHAAKEIEQAASGYVSRMKDIYNGN